MVATDTLITGCFYKRFCAGVGGSRKHMTHVDNIKTVIIFVSFSIILLPVWAGRSISK